MKQQISRRSFLGTTAVAATAATLLPFSSCGSNTPAAYDTNALVTADGKPNSKFNGVQIGAITYSFRNEANTADEVIQCCVDAALSSIELMPHSLEVGLGAPASPNIQRARGDNRPLSPEEQALRDKYNEELTAFRKDPATMEKWNALGKRFKDNGINVHIFKFVAGNTDELLDYSFKAAKALGAEAVCQEISEDACKTLGPAAERNGMLACFHQHAQYSTMTVDEIEKLLAISPAIRLNWDSGHYFGAGWENSTKLNNFQFLDHFQERIFSIHLKDKTSYKNEAAPNQNQVWGQGQTPVREFLQYIRDNYPNRFYCDIELEYAVPSWSSAVKEVGNCVRFAREALI